jgi:uncharacterized protein (UPF0332 family)
MSAEDIGNLDDLLALSLKKAEACIEDAQKLADEGGFDGAVNRAYYGIFWALSSVHLIDGNHFRRHKDAIGMFNKNYVHTGIFPKDFGHRVATAETIRHKSDYDILTHATEATAREQISFARQFYETVRNYCEQRLHEKKASE